MSFILGFEIGMLFTLAFLFAAARLARSRQ